MGELLAPSLTEAMVGSKAVGEDAHNAGLRTECVQNLNIIISILMLG